MQRVSLIRRLSIARSLRAALATLTLVLAGVTALGFASLTNARQHYENTLSQSSGLATAGADLENAGIAEEEAVLIVRGSAAPSVRRPLERAYAAAAARALALAGNDPLSARFVRAQITAQTEARQLAASGGLAHATALTGPLARARAFAISLQARQQTRQAVARAKSHSDSRTATIWVATAGLLALFAALTLITVLVSAMRKPLDALVSATRALAAGELGRRVTPAGPRELQELGVAFNAMGEELASAQHKIEEERRRLAVTIESLGDGLIVTEPDSTRILTANPRAGELVPELAVGEMVDGAESPLPPVEAALSGETIVEHRGRALAVTAAPLGSESDGVVWTVRDMSERARLEQAKSDFVATASHELRSPLTSIKGFVELLDRSPEKMTDRQREFVDIILRSTDRLVDLVNDLLDVARIEADRVEIDRRPIDVGKAVREVAELMGPRIADKHQHLGVYVASTAPLALADAGRVRQIVANLLTNAYLYTGEGGRIHVGVEADRAWVQIVVEDSGVGMTQEEIDRIFDRFFRARARGSDGRASGRPSSGTGLGLSIVKSLVEVHQGQIEVDSEPGRGTTFRVRLPVALATYANRSVEIIKDRSVLVVDDEGEIADLIARQLGSHGVQTKIANSGRQALELLHRERFDAVTLDILLPEMNGFEVLAQIRSDSELQATPIVIVSVSSASPELSGEWTVSKPIDAEVLRTVLAAALSARHSRVLVLGRENLQPVLEPELEDLGIEHHWELTGTAAARACTERRFEMALVDLGAPNPQAVLQALNHHRPRQPGNVILFSDGTVSTPAGIERLGIDVVSLERAAPALLAALRGERDE
jgi:signal transduction histidine kinase